MKRNIRFKKKFKLKLHIEKIEHNKTWKKIKHYNTEIVKDAYIGAYVRWGFLTVKNPEQFITAKATK